MKRIISIATIAFSFWTSSACVMSEEKQEDYRGKVFLGIGVETVKLPQDPRHSSTYGLHIIRVATASSAEKAGLHVGDVIVSIDGREWKGPRTRLSRSFGKAGNKSRPGGTVIFRVFRSRNGKPDFHGKMEDVKVTLLPNQGTAAERPGTQRNSVLRPDLVSYRPPYEKLCSALVRACGYEDDTADLLLRLRRAEEYPDPHRLPLVRYVHRDPFKLERISHEISDPIARWASNAAAGAPELLALAARPLLFFGRPVDPSVLGENAGADLPDFHGKNLKDHVAYIEAVLAGAAVQNKLAFSRLTTEEIQFILDHRNAMLDSYIAFRMLSYDNKPKRQANSRRLINLAKSVDINALVRQARLTALLVAPDFLASLKKAVLASRKDLGTQYIFQKKTRFGRIVISGKARTRFQGDDYAAIYDFGGDDVYANNQASSSWGKVPSSVIVDFDGDDAYKTWTPFSQACGDLGVGILVDVQGNDSYVATRFAQGTGFMGVGILIDEKGDDIYRGIEFHQGVGHWGIGILADKQGRDRYESHDTSQGVGLPGGLGLLLDAGSEADSYYCKGKEPTGYGNSPGVFEGWGQAMGVGYRPYASGGIGVIYDARGADRFEAGNFCQGGGYFYGFGLLVNDGNDTDRYIASRYGQGFGCHQAAGALIERGGNDIYQTRQFVAQGLAWDEAVALFVDESGDDRYEGGGFSQCASAMNGFTLFIERGGKDSYLYTDQARAGSNTYHGGKSLSFFLDIGGEIDKYHRNKKNNAILHGKENFIFVDLPGTLQEALQKEAWKALLPVPREKPSGGQGKRPRGKTTN